MCNHVSESKCLIELSSAKMGFYKFAKSISIMHCMSAASWHELIEFGTLHDIVLRHGPVGCETEWI